MPALLSARRRSLVPPGSRAFDPARRSWSIVRRTWPAFRRWLAAVFGGRRAPPTDDPSEAWLLSLVAGVVHEMSTPLGALASSADTIDALSRHIETDAAANDLARHVRTLRALASVQQQTAARLNETVRALERFVDLDRSDRREVDLAVSVEATLAVLGARDDDRIRVDVSARLPRLVTSARLLNRVLAHALRRALAATDPRGRVTVTIHRSGRRRVAVSIHDTGAAIAAAELGRLGSPRLAAQKERVGLDLDWAISQRALRALGGTMTVRSGAGNGTTVTLILPLAPANGVSEP